MRQKICTIALPFFSSLILQLKMKSRKDNFIFLSFFIINIIPCLVGSIDCLDSLSKNEDRNVGESLAKHRFHF